MTMDKFKKKNSPKFTTLNTLLIKLVDGKYVNRSVESAAFTLTGAEGDSQQRKADKVWCRTRQNKIYNEFISLFPRSTAIDSDEYKGKVLCTSVIYLYLKLAIQCWVTTLKFCLSRKIDFTIKFYLNSNIVIYILNKKILAFI